GVVPWWIVVVLLVRDVVLAVMQLVLARAGWAPLQVHVAGKAGTLLLLYAFALLLLGSLLPGGWGLVVTAVGWAAALWGVALYWVSGALYLAQARQVLGEERA
ncbi:MAG: CDP-alcohol phosphatidyltransferase family protein, partial [Actinobacteria bacterium]|nr:CDP-alcohol phosphatidyltransferase family protein [Actinomycetota bacterium]